MAIHNRINLTNPGSYTKAIRVGEGLNAANLASWDIQPDTATYSGNGWTVELMYSLDREDVDSDQKAWVFHSFSSAETLTGSDTPISQLNYTITGTIWLRAEVTTADGTADPNAYINIKTFRII